MEVEKIKIMLNPHRDLQYWILQKYNYAYRVAAEIERQNRLPDRERHWYQPDVILYDHNGEIKFIVEVENDPVRKALIGASILANHSVGELKQKTRPRLIFVVYTPEGIKQIKNFKEKLEIAKQYCPLLSDIEIYSEAEFKTLKLDKA